MLYRYVHSIVEQKMIDFETNERLNACEHYIDELKSEILRLK